MLAPWVTFKNSSATTLEFTFGPPKSVKTPLGFTIEVKLADLNEDDPKVSEHQISVKVVEPSVLITVGLDDDQDGSETAINEVP